MMDRKNINDEYANVKRFPFAAVINEKLKCGRSHVRL
jgi:hypothetical protein